MIKTRVETIGKVKIETFERIIIQPLKGKKPFETLETGTQILKNLGLKYWISAGTALGFYRDGDFIPHDTDIDVEVRLNYYEPFTKKNKNNSEIYKDIQKKFYDKNFRLVRRTTYKDKIMQLAFMDNQEIIFDIFFMYDWIEKENLINYTEFGTCYLPKKFVKNLCNYERYGELLHKKYARYSNDIWINNQLPSPIEDYLEFRFGKDWRVPKKEKGPWQEDANCLK